MRIWTAKRDASVSGFSEKCLGILVCSSIYFVIECEQVFVRLLNRHMAPLVFCGLQEQPRGHTINASVATRWRVSDSLRAIALNHTDSVLESMR